MRKTLTVGQYQITQDAVKALQAAKTADVAEQAFNTHAPHIHRKDRCNVWAEVDHIFLPGRYST